MIKKEGDYYICEGDEEAPCQDPVPKEDQPEEYTTVGSIGDRIAQLRQRIDTLK